MNEPICLISGVGPGTGTALARQFAAGGYRIARLARNVERLAESEQDIAGAKGYVCDVTDEAVVNQTVAV